MKIKLLFCSFLLISIVTLTNCLQTKFIDKNFKSRASQHFGVNCLFNKYLEFEYKLGFEYLNASIYMKQDRIALHGFGKMFEQLWKNQMINVGKISDYIVKRGGIVDTPGYKLSNLLTSENHFANESSIIDWFLNLEKFSNYHLLTIHKATKNNLTEINCINEHKQKYKSTQNDYKNAYSYPFQTDPYSASFLDENFLNDKVKQIKYLADLLRKIIRFDQHPKNIKGVTHNLNPLGIHLLDQQLQQEFK